VLSTRPFGFLLLPAAKKAEYAIAAAPCSSPERHLRLAKPYNSRPCGTTFELSQFWPGRRVIGGDVHRALSALLLTGAAIYTANTLLLGGKRKVMPNIRPLNRGYHSLRKALLEHGGERAAALSKALDEVNRLRNTRRETTPKLKEWQNSRAQTGKPCWSYARRRASRAAFSRMQCSHSWDAALLKKLGEIEPGFCHRMLKFLRSSLLTLPSAPKTLR
jgi:hypothetical protein